MRADEQKPDRRRQRRTSGQRIAKSISIKGAKRRSGGCAPKAIELTPGDLLRVVPRTTEGSERPPDRGAEVSRRHSRSAVGKASEALHGRKAEQRIGRAETMTEGPND